MLNCEFTSCGCWDMIFLNIKIWFIVILMFCFIYLLCSKYMPSFKFMWSLQVCVVFVDNRSGEGGEEEEKKKTRYKFLSEQKQGVRIDVKIMTSSIQIVGESQTWTP